MEGNGRDLIWGFTVITGICFERLNKTTKTSHRIVYFQRTSRIRKIKANISIAVFIITIKLGVNANTQVCLMHKPVLTDLLFHIMMARD